MEGRKKKNEQSRELDVSVINEDESFIKGQTEQPISMPLSLPKGKKKRKEKKSLVGVNKKKEKICGKTYRGALAQGKAIVKSKIKEKAAECRTLSVSHEKKIGKTQKRRRFIGKGTKKRNRKCQR